MSEVRLKVRATSRISSNGVTSELAFGFKTGRAGHGSQFLTGAKNGPAAGRFPGTGGEKGRRRRFSACGLAPENTEQDGPANRHLVRDTAGTRLGRRISWGVPWIKKRATEIGSFTHALPTHARSPLKNRSASANGVWPFIRDGLTTRAVNGGFEFQAAFPPYAHLADNP
jgi:hypothetical protein